MGIKSFRIGHVLYVLAFKRVHMFDVAWFFDSTRWIRHHITDRISFRDGIRVTFCEDAQGESWHVLSIGGSQQESFRTNSPYDCSGEVFCSSVRKYCFGLIMVGYYGIDV